MPQPETLVCIFSGASTQIIEQLENQSEGSKPGKIRPGKQLGNIWEEATTALEQAETALFLPGLIHNSDEYPSGFRRFVQVGNSKKEKVRNLFELAFEKGYSRCLFVEDYTPLFETKLIDIANQKLAENDMVLGPKTDGSLYIWGLNLDAYSTVHGFDTDLPEVIVEFISLCNETDLRYALLESVDPETAWGRFKKKFEG